ncbi:NADPH:quinone reductase [Streptoalloteichus tenebrarius]|uniref:NADPH:quinone reductase n=1 Tax=Streptoalloteichus tenebrarius (strain ATCC 17920 / DSM 40477 / JCM 4838 / CBS 697.72 / NBRC 16177 / NCIMB 11028 / NRRL B-12390 / A12253. 1 / ISP 5477) TaxID=1933 RepID=A0ABT1I1E0_STRSD|nr:NADP-dependent oxidoreductase [Streptoalloteichus tenebrarius]MCP2261607.1 NADPH:quinone reductase [Streptoalloteichus tenebrarius]BFE99391.1 NADP-dependent oxidoreductase [Streptoalloteichus tenebrarius]
MPQVLQYSEYGGPEVLKLVDVELPEPGEGQVRVLVRAAGVNPIDWKLRRGFFAQGEPLTEPAGVGFEVAGVIDALGPGVDRWTVGQAVFGYVPTGGGVATHAVTPADALVARPEWLDENQAAGMPLVVETATRTLRELGVGEGHTLLVHAAAGGVGVIASQLALARGARVVGTASPANHDFLRELGVVPVDYAADGLADRIRAAAPRGVDRVLDASGRDVLPLSIELTGSPDHVVTIADGRAAEFGVRFSSNQTPPADATAEVLPLLERGDLRLPKTILYPLDEAVAAYRHSEDGHPRGKLVIRVQD